MKFVLLFLSLCMASLFAAETGSVNNVMTIRVADVNKEQVAGAKVECLGTGFVAYTNSRGECFIPSHILRQSKMLKVESVSYKSRQIEKFDLSMEIILEFR